MCIVNSICLWHILVIPTIMSGFIAADEQYRDTPRIESVQYSQRTSLMLNP